MDIHEARKIVETYLEYKKDDIEVGVAEALQVLLDRDIPVERIEEVMVRHIASHMKPPITFDDKAYKVLGNLAPKGIKDLAQALKDGLGI